MMREASVDALPVRGAICGAVHYVHAMLVVAARSPMALALTGQLGPGVASTAWTKPKHRRSCKASPGNKNGKTQGQLTPIATRH